MLRVEEVALAVHVAAVPLEHLEREVADPEMVDDGETVPLALGTVEKVRMRVAGVYFEKRLIRVVYTASSTDSSAREP